MISKVKGKTEISLYLAGILPLAFLPFSFPGTLRSFCFCSLWSARSATRHPCAVSGINPFTED